MATGRRPAGRKACKKKKKTSFFSFFFSGPCESSTLARSEKHDLCLLPDADKLDPTLAASLDNGGNVNMWVNCTFKGGREVRITTRISGSRPDLKTLYIFKYIYI